MSGVGGEGGGGGGAGVVRRALPWTVSFAAHGVLIAAGFVVVWSADRPGEREVGRTVLSFDAPAPAPAPAPALAERPEAERVEAEALAAEAAALPALAGLPAVDELLPALGVPAALRGSGVESSLPGAEAVLARDTPPVRFFGLGSSNAERVVYVIDGSGSTVSTLPMIRRELTRSLSRLSPTQSFQVIFFTGAGDGRYVSAPHPLDGPGGARTTRLIRATGRNVSAVTSWLGGFRSAGSADVLPALSAALALDPDAVFLLGTGFDGAGRWERPAGEVLAALERMNPVVGRDGEGAVRRVTIKAVQVVADDPSGLLEAIGTAHGGRDGYTFRSLAEIGR